MDDNTPATDQKLEAATAELVRLGGEKARAELELKGGGTVEAQGRYQKAVGELEYARRHERATRWEIEAGAGWDVRGRGKIDKIWGRWLREEEERAVQRAFLWAGSAVDRLGEDRRRAEVELEEMRGQERVLRVLKVEHQYQELGVQVQEMQAIEAVLLKQVFRLRRWRGLWTWRGWLALGRGCWGGRASA